MTNHPSSHRNGHNPNRLRALGDLPAEPPGGFVMIGQPQRRPQQIEWHPLDVAAKMAASIQVGQPFPVGSMPNGQPVLVPMPDLSETVQQMAALVAPSEDATDQLAALQLLADFQRGTAAVIARFKARHAPPEPTALPPAADDNDGTGMVLP